MSSNRQHRSSGHDTVTADNAGGGGPAPRVFALLVGIDDYLPPVPAL
jgi:hypothetical protein